MSSSYYHGHLSHRSGGQSKNLDCEVETVTFKKCWE